MSRTKQVKTIIVGVRVAPELLRNMENFAASTGRKTGEAMRHLLQRGLEADAEDRRILERVKARREEIAVEAGLSQ